MGTVLDLETTFKRDRDKMCSVRSGDQDDECFYIMPQEELLKTWVIFNLEKRRL